MEKKELVEPKIGDFQYIDHQGVKAINLLSYQKALSQYEREKQEAKDK